MKELIYDFGGYNQDIFYYINTLCNQSVLPYLLKYVSMLFDVEMFAIYYCIIVVYLARKIKYIAHENKLSLYSKHYDFMVRFGVGYACFGFVYAFLKFTFNMPRPFCSLPLDSFITIIDITKERCLSSFPSSHVGLSLLITLFLWKSSNKIMRMLYVVIIYIVSISRITLAMHYPSDILYSLIFTLFVYAVSCFVYNALKPNIILYFKDKIWNRFIS